MIHNALLPCPFCGAIPEIIECDCGVPSNLGYFGICCGNEECEVETEIVFKGLNTDKEKLLQKAIDIWNRRI